MQYNPDELKEIINIFNSESEEIIQELNDNFLELEKNTLDKTPIKKLLRLSHSLKGAARMLGFNSIQDIAHKIEDILSYWKNDNVKINKESFQVMYETCDYLTILIGKCVELKADCKDEKYSACMSNLEALDLSEGNSPKNGSSENNAAYIKTKNVDINAIVLELMFVIEQDEDDDILPVITDNLTLLFDIFAQTSFSDIKKEISSLLETANSEQNSGKKVEFFKENIPRLRNNIYNLFKEFNINAVKKSSPEKQESGSIQKNEEKQNNNFEKEFDTVLSNLQKIKYDISYAAEIINCLNKIQTSSEAEKDILEKVIKILNLFSDKNMQLNNDCYLVILQCMYMFKRISLKKEDINQGNLEFLIQRLNVVEDMFNIMNTAKMSAAAKETNVISSEDYSELKKNIPSGFDFQEIKTLRVDTVKLDNLIAQTGELLINGIKTRNHLKELAEINSEVLKWNGDTKKILNYLKYLEKKGFFTQNADESVTAFCKKVQNFFNENSVVINNVNKKLNSLYNIMFTDDGKLYQNAMEIDVIAKGIRVLPLATIFHSFPRMIRDIAKENNKQIDFIITGSDTTIDKKLMEEIKMPLIHLLRNAVSHGIERPEERIKKNKNETGTIKLTAKQAENYVIISIEDDGFGIDTEKVKEISVKKGLLTEEEAKNIDNEHLVKLLFLPGFSTSESIDEISGRGVGLDIVKTKILNLNGDIYIDSEINKGCKVTIKLPLTMSTIKTFIVLADGQKYAIPINTIKYVKTIKTDEIYKKDNQTCIVYNSHSIPVFSLSEILTGKVQDENSETCTVIIVEIQDRQAAFKVDKLLGDQEVFQKKLSAPIIKIKNISGFTTLANGEICLILNPYEIMKNNAGNNYIDNVVTKLISVDKNNSPGQA